MRTRNSSAIVAGLLLAGLLMVAAPRQAQAQYYSYYVASPVYVAPSPVWVTPVPVYVAPTVAYYTYPAYVSYRSPCYYRGHPKRYYDRAYCGGRGTSVGFSFGYYGR